MPFEVNGGEIVADDGGSRRRVSPVRRRVQVSGAVQGVGFRPFVYRLAQELGLSGWIVNDVRGVDLEVEGAGADVREFERRLRREIPPLAHVCRIEASDAEVCGSAGFEIRGSSAAGDRLAMMLPDVRTCPDCMREVYGDTDRRAGYPFTNCTNCGPRFSIIRRLPYDRPNTSMAGFELCDRCRREYEDPGDRRFHAQPTACPDCGPHLWLQDAHGHELGEGDPIELAAARLRSGAIVALKGLGGFLLLADGENEEVVAELRRRKRRPAKPFAVMVADAPAACALCHVDEDEAELLSSPQAPIVLLRRREGATLARGVAPANPRVGLMLPTTPLHQLLADAVGAPLIATSGNLTDEPISIDNEEARTRLGNIADLFLMHERPIVRHVDDSVVWVLAGRPQTLRRARGLAPLPVSLRRAQPSVLAVGAHLKNAVALGMRAQVFISQHIGDMETSGSIAAFERVIGDFLDMYAAAPEAVAHDLHPDYASTRWAIDATEGRGGPAVLHGLEALPVQHHHAHLVSCLADNDVEGEALGVIWDGAGLGTDGTVWGGEFLLGDARGYRRVARFRPFSLPGGDAAAREPRRVALALLREIDPQLSGRASAAIVASFGAAERELLSRMIDRGINTPLTSSVGRLFDAVAAITGVADEVSYEGEAAMKLEFAAGAGSRRGYALPIDEVPPPRADLAARVNERIGGEILEIDWRPLIASLADDVADGVAASDIAAGFHQALIEAVATVAEAVGAPRVVISGGCFQNRRLQEGVLQRLPEVGCSVLVQRGVPANDGGISLGQAVIAAARLRG